MTVQLQPLIKEEEMSEKKPVQVLIVDDEPLACRRIRRMLQGDPEVEVTAMCTTGSQVEKAIEEHSPDLVFLDIQMPGMDGLTALKSIPPEKLPHVIFVTAYDQYALQAFEVHALDYLLKPFDRARFDAAVKRAKLLISQERSTGMNEGIVSLLRNLKERREYVRRLVIKENGRIFFVKPDEIDWIEAQGKYVYLHTGKESHLMRESISTLEVDLDPKQFIRIHRSTIVNLERIQELQPWFHGEYRVVLRNGIQLMLSRSYRDRLQELFGKPV